MTLLYYDPLFLEHQTGKHPEQPLRLERIVERLQARGLDRRCARPRWKDVSAERMARVHQEAYTDELARFAEAGGGRIEADTVVSAKSFAAAKRAAGAVCDAVERVVRGEQQRALCLVRPPGHHALETGAMGFCLLNNVAIAARMATRELQLDRVLIVDWDVHHGNGTQDAFWEDSQVAFLSIHRFPFYPGTGDANETGAGRGLGGTLNLPVAFGMERAEYLKLLRDRLEQFAERMKPQLILLSAGFDSHREDPVGSLGLETEDFGPLSDLLIETAKQHCGGKLVSLLEGGYHVDRLADCTALHLERLLASDEAAER